MKIKLLEVRDRATFIPVAAIKVEAANEAQAYLLMRSGWGDNIGINMHIYLFPLNNSPVQVAYDPYDWPQSPRTMHVAHFWVSQHWDEIEDGSVIDVEFILSETQQPKVSERFSGWE